MSAITGIYHLNEEPVNLQHGQGLMTALQKYPADDMQIWHSEKVFLGCHAQWITPESIGEQLPYYDHERQLAITVDAIIDNREELFERLQIDRKLRKTIPDSQLILLAYNKWGEESPKYLVGDYAFMIWDEKKQQLFGARDPSGYRTLYYYRNQTRFAFCTVIEPLLDLPYIGTELNEQWLSEYLAITGMIDTVDARMTPYRHLEQIPPFHSITVLKDKIKINRYGTFTSDKRLKLKSDNDYIEAFQDVFQKAVTSRLRTHHKVGSQLSGGLDSGSVVAFAARELRERKKTLHTFSYIPPNDFEDFTHKLFMPDERPYIKTTVQHVGGITDHYLDFEGKSSYSEIDDLLDVMEMPYKFLENSFWLKGIFEKAGEAGIGVLLNGDRGNFTISWGAAEDYYATLLKKLKWLRLNQELNQYCKNVGGSRLRLLPGIAKTGFPIIHQLMSKGPPAEHPVLINRDFAERTGIFNKLKRHGIDETGWISSPNLYEQKRVLFEDMLPWNSGNTLDSKLSLRHGLWKRDPTNDLRVVRFCLSVPEDQYVQNGLDRALIRRSTEKILPEKIRLNQRVFGVQGADWVHRMIPYWDTFIDEATQLSMDKRILEFIDEQKIKSALITVKEGARPEYFANFDYRILMRSVIVYRFLKKFT
ncbi:lasso peptide isopeptide bond-forming cyclase [Peribacillus sp. NPDC096379]|uniref:lasso peptide isopeptide bond-forming cyclase n=1 Tax=Peribacillus sp. NPDC096379 TaxID=3364393 RepID=UPI0038226B9E